MKISLGREASEKKNSAACTVTEHHLNHELFDVAGATITGRYPDARRAVNTQCAEMAYVIEGSGKVVVNHQEQELNPGDVVVIEAGEKYYWEGNLRLLLSCSPAWHPEQHQMVD